MAVKVMEATAVKSKTCKKVDRYEVKLENGTEVGSLYLPKDLVPPVNINVKVAVGA